MINNLFEKKKKKPPKLFSRISQSGFQFSFIIYLIWLLKFLESFWKLHIEMRVYNAEKHAKCLISSLEGIKISSPSQKHPVRDRTPAQKLIQLEKRIKLSIG